MSNTQTVGNISDWSGMFKDMWRQIGDGSLTLSHFQALINHRNPFAITSLQEEWQEFYRKYFRLSVDFSAVQIPEDKEDFSRVLFIQEGLTIGQVIKGMMKHFPVWTYTEDLDQDLTENDRNTKTSYAIRVRDRVEADQELQNLSAKDLQKQEIKTLTLLERLVYELKYYSETNEHLDVDNITLCAGSRDRYGFVSHVDWRGDGLNVDYAGPSSAHGDLRARQSVS